MASSHAFLVATSPEPNSVVGPPLEAIDLRFVEVVKPIEVQLREADNGQTLLANWGETSESDFISLPVDVAEAGNYTIEFEAVSADGHVVDGEFRFEIAEGAPRADRLSAASPPQSDRRDNSLLSIYCSSSGGSFYGLVASAIVVAAFLAIATFAMNQRYQGVGGAGLAIGRVLTASLLLMVLTGIVLSLLPVGEAACT